MSDRGRAAQAGPPVVAEIAEAVEAAVAAGRTVGAVAILADRDGVIHQSAHGRRAVDDPAPMTADTVFRLYSMTKAIGTVAALKLVEQGRLSLDAPVADILPRFAGIKVFDGFHGGEPRFRDPKTPVLVRHLAAHTSGLVYEQWDEDHHALARHRRAAGTATGDLSDSPLMFDPGTRWGYGQSTDWLGIVVEVASGEPIRDFLTREILAPLAMPDTDVIFRPDTAPRRPAVHVRAPDGGFARLEVDGPPDAPPPAFHGMGGCMKGTGPDYIRFLRMFLNGGELDGARILAPETLRLMMDNQIGALRVERHPTTLPARSAPLELFPEIEKTFTLGFMRAEQDLPGRRRAGSVGWAGLMNTHFWIDPARGVAGVVMMQQAPFLSPDALAVYDGFERAACAHVDGRATP